MMDKNSEKYPILTYKKVDYTNSPLFNRMNYSKLKYLNLRSLFVIYSKCYY